MPLSDIYLVVRWWGTLFLIGAAAFPFARRLFPHWHDQGYAMAKAVGLITVSWVVYVLSMARIVAFGEPVMYGAIVAVFIVGIGLHSTKHAAYAVQRGWKRHALTIALQEAFFLLALLYWSYVKAHEPSIRGLEKFMDYGFMQSILASVHFPPADMWYPPYPVNYYYFGHLVTAVLTKLSGLDLSVTFNLMLATLFAFCLTMSYAMGYELIIRSGFVKRGRSIAAYIGGALTAYLTTLAGNMQTIYAFTQGYDGEDVKPFWELWWRGREFWDRLADGMLRYWYANATRFIPYTIHEFPSYSFVVSDVHGHVLSIPFVLLALALIITVFGTSDGKGEETPETRWLQFGFYGFLCGILLMTNALDGPIYMALFLAVYLTTRLRMGGRSKRQWKDVIASLAALLVPAVIAGMPFLSHFKSFVNGIAVNCPIPFFANSRIGPLLFEGVEKCQRSPLWMVWLLWGFFWYCGLLLVFAVVRWNKARSPHPAKKSFLPYLRDKINSMSFNFTQNELLLMVWFSFSMLLIMFPEFFYFKDIYPQHFRSNTMFKLGYQAFMMWGIVSGYAIVRLVAERKTGWPKFVWPALKTVLLLLLVPQLFLVAIYPTFSVRSYFGGLKTYQGLSGITWFAGEYPDDFAAMLWLKEQQAACTRNGTACHRYTLVEADGDSYTDYERFSVFSGTPTVIGWAVHEWLWRGTYDVVAPRREEVRKIYESPDIAETKAILERYGVRYVVIGSLERQKFTALAEWKFTELGTEAFRANTTVVYEIDAYRRQ